MIIELYHGSDHIIEQPELGKGRLKNDYGKGFYCTEERDLSREWGVSRSRDGIVNQYQLETNGLTDYSGPLRATCPEFESHHSGE